MARLRITGCKRGLERVGMTKAIRLRAGLDLAAALKCTNAVLAGETVIVEVPTPSDAQILAEELASLGAVAEVAE